MTSLIKRLEALTGPDREVDNQIFFIVHNINFKRDEYAPRFTGSIDAARSICSDALLVYASDIGGDGLPYVELCTSTATPVAVHEGIGATIEIAWCIAALKARGVK